MEHQPAQVRSPAAPSCAGMPDDSSIVPAVRAPTRPEPVPEPPAAPRRRAGRLLPLMMIAVLLGLALLSLAVSLRL